MLDSTERPNVEEMRKVCKACGTEKTISEFYCHKRNGLPSHSTCKECSKKKQKEKYYLLFAPGQPRNEEAKAQQKKRDATYASRHGDKRRAANHQTYLRNKEKVIARSIAWKKKNREYGAAAMAMRRAKSSLEDSHTRDDINNLLALQKNKCAVCRNDIKNTFTVDHVIPLKRGGGNERENIQLLCRSCNSQKSAKDPINFMQQKGFLL